MGTLDDVGFSSKKVTQRRDTSPKVERRASSSDCSFYTENDEMSDVLLTNHVLTSDEQTLTPLNMLLPVTASRWGSN